MLGEGSGLAWERLGKDPGEGSGELGGSLGKAWDRWGTAGGRLGEGLGKARRAGHAGALLKLTQAH